MHPQPQESVLGLFDVNPGKVYQIERLARLFALGEDGRWEAASWAGPQKKGGAVELSSSLHPAAVQLAAWPSRC